MAVSLAARDLALIRGDRCLFRELDFTLERGQLLLIEGANGSGKTSLLQAIAGLLPLDEGVIRWAGAPVAGQRQAFCAELVWLAHRPGLKLDLTPGQNLRFESRLRPSAFRKLPAVSERLGLTGLAALPLRALSAGQQRRVALARLLLSEARLWLMDEPFTNLDAPGQSLVLDIVDEHLAAGGLCVMATHQPVSVDAPLQRVRL